MTRKTNQPEAHHRVRLVGAPETVGTILEATDAGWVTILWDGSDHGPNDYHAPFTRGRIVYEAMCLECCVDPFLMGCICDAEGDAGAFDEARASA